AVLVLPLVVAACTGADEHTPTPDDGPYDPVVPLAPPPEGEGFQLQMQALAPAHEEIWMCEIFDRLPVDDVFQYVQRAESRQNAGVHHADLMTFFYTGLELAPGQYDCGELYATYAELMEDGVLIYASQLEEDEIVLPEGYVAT